MRLLLCESRRGRSPHIHSSARATQFSAEFAIPVGLTPGEYAVSISSGLGGWVSLDSFVSAEAPHVSTLTVTPPIEWPAGVWVVSQVRKESGLP
jgi:hypothetical protein